MEKAPVSVIILTYNEEVNIRACLESARGLSDEIFLVDSFSTDRTLEIAREFTDKIYQNPWVHWAHQRNWAVDNLPISYEWVFFLDADERLTNDLRMEIKESLVNPQNLFDAFYIKISFYFLGKWLKNSGYRKNYILRLIKRRKAHSIGSGAREYVTMSGKFGYLQHPLIHQDNKDLSFWVSKHNHLASLEAQEMINFELKKGIFGEKASPNNGTKIDRSLRIWLREKIFRRLPLLIRPFFSFVYRYFGQYGFLDGKEGFIYCFLHGLWYPLLIDAKYLELKRTIKENKV